MFNARRLLSGLWFAAAALTAWSALPAEVSTLQPTRLEILKEGKPAGAIGLRTGESLAVLGSSGEFVLVRYRNLNGRVPAAHTTLPQTPPPAEVAPPVAAPSPPDSTPAPPAVAPALPTAPPPPAPARAPATAIERALAGKLVALTGGVLRPRPSLPPVEVRFYGLYFSAGWCGPCRRFTPELIDAYGKIRALYPEFEVVFVSRDKSPADLLAYMREERMPWPALEWTTIRATREITRYAGSGIPCLVLIDADGRILSDSYRWGRYVGPDAVLEDTWKLLREHRRRHPRPDP